MEKTILYTTILLLFLCGCKKTDSSPAHDSRVIGQWELDAIRLKSASVGNETVEIYMDFYSDTAFELYQKIGEGRFRHYSGNWSMDGGLLNGRYSDGEPWGCSYSVEFEHNDKTMLLSSSGEVYSYKRTSIPSEVRNGAIDTKSAAGNVMASGSRAVLP